MEATYEPSPMKQNARVIQSGQGYLDLDVKNYLRSEVSDKIQRDIPVLEFIEAVWGLVPESEGLEEFQDITLDLLGCQEFYDGIKEGERTMYGPLRKIICNIVEQLPDGWKQLAANFEVIDHKVIGSFAEFKPDMGWSETADPRSQYWEWIPMCWEVKNPDRKSGKRVKEAIVVHAEDFKALVRLKLVIYVFLVD